MAFFEDLKGKATDLVQSGVAKSMQLAEIAKLKTANMGEEDTIKKAYIELGKLYYAERGSAPEAAYASACQRITDAMARISYNNERIADIKAAGQLSDDEVDETEPVDGEPAAEEPSCCCGCDEPAAEDDKPEE